MILLSAGLFLLVAVLLSPSVSEFISLLRLPFTRPPLRKHVTASQPMLVFLVLAHNEELLLPSCLASLFAQRYPQNRRRVVVVADNCTDHGRNFNRPS